MTSNEQGLLKTAAWKWITRLLLIAISVTMLFPLLWNLYSSFKTNTEFLADAFTLPSHLEWDNYVRAFEKSHLLDNIWNPLFRLQADPRDVYGGDFHSGDLYHDPAVSADEGSASA